MIQIEWLKQVCMDKVTYVTRPMEVTCMSIIVNLRRWNNPLYYFQVEVWKFIVVYNLILKVNIACAVRKYTYDGIVRKPDATKKIIYRRYTFIWLSFLAIYLFWPHNCLAIFAIICKLTSSS